MPRQAMQFTDDQALFILNHFRRKLDDYEWRESNMVKQSSFEAWFDFERQASAEIARLTKLTEDCGSRRTPDPKPVPPGLAAEVRLWLQTYIRPEGWTRYLAAQRQERTTRSKLHASGERVASLPLTVRTTWNLSDLGKQAGLDKKALLDDLTSYLLYDDTGKKAFSGFVTHQRAKQRTEGHKLLQAAFQADKVQVDAGLRIADVEAGVLGSEAQLLAYKAGAARLARLAKRSPKNLPPAGRLAWALKPQGDFGGRSPLAMALDGPLEAVGKPVPPTESSSLQG